MSGKSRLVEEAPSACEPSSSSASPAGSEAIVDTLPDEITSASEISIALRSAPESCEGNTARLWSNTSLACELLTLSGSATIDSVPNVAREALVETRTLRSWRDKQLEEQCHEFDAKKKLLAACESQLRVDNQGNEDWRLLEATVEQLLAELEYLPSQSSVVFACGETSVAVSEAIAMTYTQQGVDASQREVSHAEWFKCGQGDTVRLTCRDAFGEVVRAVREQDVHARFKDADNGWAVSEPSVVEGIVSVVVTPAATAARTATLDFIVDGARIEAPLQVSYKIQGTHCRTLLTRYSHDNTGLAISPDGTRMAVSNGSMHSIVVYSLPDCALQAEFGGHGTGPGQFNRPRNICFSPCISGNLLITDSLNMRVQEMTLEGRYVRTIGSGIINSPVVGIAATTDMVAVGVERSASRPQLFMFDLVSGDLIRSFGEHGGSAGQLSGCYGLQFTRDGAHLLVAESDNHRLSLFTSAGAFVRSRSAWANEPSSVVIASNGAVLVPCASVHRVCVIPLEMSPLHPPPTVRRRVFPAPFNFGSEGDGTGQFNRPTALAMHGGQVYVLDAHSARVQVFN